MEKLLSFVNDAYNNVIMYARKKYEKGTLFTKWNDVPVLNKNELVEAGQCAVFSSCLGVINTDQTMKSVTSGTTGKYVEVYWKTEEFKRSLISLWLYRYRYYGILPGHKLVYFYTDVYDEQEMFCRQEKNQLGFCKRQFCAEELRAIYEEILDFNPKWMILQPSMAVILMDFITRYELPVPKALCYIEYTGEILTESVRRRSQMVFGCKIANMYGMNEVNSIALECPYGNMHVFADNVYVEIVDDNDSITPGEGDILVTSKNNTIMPIIRYRTGDMGKLTKKNCKCGNCNPTLTLSYGRKMSFITGHTGERISPYIFMRIFDDINRSYEGCILQYKVKQVKEDFFEIKLYCDMEGINLILLEKQILYMMRAELGEKITCKIFYLKELLEEGGKYQFFEALEENILC